MFYIDPKIQFSNMKAAKDLYQRTLFSVDKN